MDLQVPADAVRHPLSGLKPDAETEVRGEERRPPSDYTERPKDIIGPSDFKDVREPDFTDVVDRPDIRDIKDIKDIKDIRDIRDFRDRPDVVDITEQQ